jgi:outer membrane protein assembly factor BamB
MNSLSLFPPALFLLLLGCGQQPSAQSQEPGNLQAETAFENNLENHRQWPSFRGFYARGSLDGANLPEKWDVETMEHVKWKTPIPGLGLSSPVIWEGTIFVTSAVGEGGQEGIKTGIYGEGEPVEDESILEWKVYAIDQESGEIRWERVATRGTPEVKRHPKSSHANPTMAVDGTHAVAFFGSEGVYCYDFSGELLWSKDFGLLMSSAHGVDWAEWEFASSPVLYNGVLIIQADVKDNSFLAALDVETGEYLWKQERDDWPGWSTPNIYYDQGRVRVAVNGYQHRGGYDLETGEEVWWMSGGGDVPVPTPIHYKDLLFFNSAHGRQSPILAIRKNATGRIRYPQEEKTDSSIVWFLDRGGAYLQTMLVYKDLLYNMRWNGNLACFDASTGIQQYRETVSPESFVASPVASDDRIYLVSEVGDVHIVKAGPEFKLLQVLPLGEVTLSTPAIADGIIVFRTTGHLIGVGN